MFTVLNLSKLKIVFLTTSNAIPPSVAAVSFTLYIFVNIKKFHFYSMTKALGGSQQIKNTD